jgi:hypothetical protein
LITVFVQKEQETIFLKISMNQLDVSTVVESKIEESKPCSSDSIDRKRSSSVLKDESLIKNENASNNDDKRRRTSIGNENPLTIVDTASILGLKAGDRIEVRWELSSNDSDETSVRWWGATLLEHDGQCTDDGVAIRVLDYDPCEEWGYPDRSLENVIFGNELVLIDPVTLDQLYYRKEGEDSVVGLGEDDLREELNDMMMGILDKHKLLWQGLDAAKQAQIGELVANGKEALIATIQNRFNNDKKPIAAEDIPSILEEAFEGLRNAKMTKE